MSNERKQDLVHTKQLYKALKAANKPPLQFIKINNHIITNRRQIDEEVIKAWSLEQETYARPKPLHSQDKPPKDVSVRNVNVIRLFE